MAAVISFVTAKGKVTLGVAEVNAVPKLRTGMRFVVPEAATTEVGVVLRHGLFAAPVEALRGVRGDEAERGVYVLGTPKALLSGELLQLIQQASGQEGEAG